MYYHECKLLAWLLITDEEDKGLGQTGASKSLTERSNNNSISLPQCTLYQSCGLSFYIEMYDNIIWKHKTLHSKWQQFCILQPFFFFIKKKRENQLITILGLVYTYTSIFVSLFDPCIIHVRWVFLNKTSNIHTVTLQTQICQHHNMYFKFTFTNDASNTDKCVHLRHRFQKSCLSSRKHWKWHFWKPLPWSFQKAQFSVA